MFAHGMPCWYEFAAPSGRLDEAAGFYAALVGWQVRSAGMEGIDYRLAGDDRGLVAGLYETPEAAPNWIIYYLADDVDAAVAQAKTAGGKVVQEPVDIPGTGRIAILTDPQGADFGMLQPLPMTDEEMRAFVPAFDPGSAGRGSWSELMTDDPERALDFYAALFGWQKSRSIPMDEDGTYQLFSHGGTDIGAVMGLGNAPAPRWLPYFGVEGVNHAISQTEARGGKLLAGPMEVPGPAHIAILQDPLGAAFAVIGPLEAI